MKSNMHKHMQPILCVFSEVQAVILWFFEEFALLDALPRSSTMQDGIPTRRSSYMQDGTPTRHSSYYATDHQHHQGCVHGLDLKLNSFPDKDVPHWGYICGTCCQDVAAPAYLQERPWTDSLVLKTGNIANCLLARCLTSGNLVVFESSALAALPSA